MKSKYQVRVEALDRVFSKYVRLSNADFQGYCVCCTCGKTTHWKQIQAGHFQSRRHLNTRWDEMNVFPQCPFCNKWGSGEQFKMAKFIDARYGDGTAQKIAEKAMKKRKFSVIELKYLEDKYKKKLKELL